MGNWISGTLGLRVILVAMTAMMIAPGAWAGTAVLSWDANSEPDLAGYRVYYGESRPYSQRLDVGNVTTYTVGGLLEGRTYYFAVTAYNLLNRDSAYSNEVGKTIPDTTPSRLINLSTRGLVQTNAEALIGGFIVSGTSPITVLIRARGPSMGNTPFLVPGTLANPTMRLVSAGTTIVQNDDWLTTDPLCLSPATACGSAAQITATGKDPCVPNPGQNTAPSGCGQEAAMLVTLPPGPYSVVASGVGGTTGIGLVEVFEVDTGSLSKLTNISTRGTVVSASGGLLNGGFIIDPSGSGSKQVLIRARGPSMDGAPFFVPETLQNPTMRLVSEGTTIAQNDNWSTTDPLCLSPATACGGAALIRATGKDPCVPNPGQTAAPPACTQEAALLVTLPPGPYSVVVSGFGGTTGIALVEVFELSP